jgi:hypothetical protein
VRAGANIRAALATIAALLTLTGTAVGEPIAEPNDDITQARGPLAPGTVYDGNFGSPNDVDYLVFYVGGPRQIDVAVTKVGAGCSTRIDAALLDGDGKDVPGEFSTPTTVARITQASGPLSNGISYSGVFDTPNDADWYVFHVNGPKQIDASVTKVGAGCSTSIGAALLDGDGHDVPGEFSTPTTVYSNQTEHMTYTTPAAGRYYVVVSNDCAGDPYQLRVGPGDAITTTPTGAAPTEQAAATPEPNDSIAQASGPIVGATAYAGALDTVNDRDYFKLLVPGGRQIDVAITKVGDGCGSRFDAALFTGDEEDASTNGVSSNSTTHLTANPTTNTTYYLRMTGSCAGNPYQFRVDPGDAVVQTFTPPALPPPTPVQDPSTSAACRSAKARAKTAARNLRSAKAKVKQARTRRARSRANKLLAARKKQLKTAQRRQRKACRGV